MNTDKAWKGSLILFLGFLLPILHNGFVVLVTGPDGRKGIGGPFEAKDGIEVFDFFARMPIGLWFYFLVMVAIGGLLVFQAIVDD